jgi:DNA invertase Pin-like site-specific DNA recombinase
MHADAASHQKVTSNHLQRDAYLYVRQSTLRQVLENTESTKRQYGLRDRAVALGWAIDRVVVIDSDLGQSGASSDREGFQRLVAAVGMGKVGVVLGLEVSRLARSSTDWHRLLEICALTDTVILDEDGLYNPGQFNDRLLLGLKGTMSEAELHVLRARLQGGIFAKASRGELEMSLPVGLVYAGDGRVALDPDQQVQAAVRTLFDTFGRTSSASLTVRHFREHRLLFPRRLRTGPHKGELAWGPLRHWRVLNALHNPRYAGAFAFGRSKTRPAVGGGSTIRKLPRSEWHTLLLDTHPGYITWAEYEENLRRLHENSRAHGSDRRHGPAREGPALLQGLAVCGRCGNRMTVRYQQRAGELFPTYICQRERIANSDPVCQQIVGRPVDDVVGELLVEAVTPLALEVALSVQLELERRSAEVDQMRRQHVQRARYEAELAQRRYLHVDPNNRLVADSLEADWNQKLKALTAAQEEYERQSKSDGAALTSAQRAEIMSLATDFPRLWRDPQTSHRERKRMVRLMLEDVTMIKGERVVAHVRFRGGASRTLSLDLPLNAWQKRMQKPEVVAEIDRLLEHHTERQIVAILNQRGLTPGAAKCFNRLILLKLRLAYRLDDRFTRLRRRGLLTQEEIADRLGVCVQTVKIWYHAGLLAAHPYNDKGGRLYEPPDDSAPRKMMGRPLRARRRFFMPESAQEVQCSA